MNDMTDGTTDTGDIPGQIREFVVGALSPDDLHDLDVMTATIEQQGDQVDEDGNLPDGALSGEDVRDLLESAMSPEQFKWLECLIGQLDDGPAPAGQQRQQATELTNAARRRTEKEKETNMTTNSSLAQDEALSLRLQIRRAGIPIGNNGSLATLRSLAQAYGLRTRGPVAMDSASVPRRLSLASMYPKLKARWDAADDGPQVLAVPAEPASDQRYRSSLAMDGKLPSRLHIDTMFPGLRDRVKVG
jgi:hypothetical protein